VKPGCRVEQAEAKDFTWLSRNTYRCPDIRELFKLRDNINCINAGGMENAPSSLSMDSSRGALGLLSFAAIALDDIEIIEQKGAAGTMQSGGVSSAHGTGSLENPIVQSRIVFAQDDTAL
jgi:hypothetical protein